MSNKSKEVLNMYFENCDEPVKNSEIIEKLVNVEEMSLGRIPKVTLANSLGYMLDWEGGDISPEGVIGLFSYLIKSGLAWKLQGSIYGRPAESMIDNGIFDRRGNILDTSMFDDDYDELDDY